MSCVTFHAKNMIDAASSASPSAAIVAPAKVGYGSGLQSRYGGESVSQSPLKDRAFLNFLGQNLPFELRPKTGVSPPIFSWNPSWLIQVLAQPSISVSSGQQGWFAFALRRSCQPSSYKKGV